MGANTLEMGLDINIHQMGCKMMKNSVKSVEMVLNHIKNGQYELFMDDMDENGLLVVETYPNIHTMVCFGKNQNDVIVFQLNHITTMKSHNNWGEMVLNAVFGAYLEGKTS